MVWAGGGGARVIHQEPRILAKKLSRLGVELISGLRSCVAVQCLRCLEMHLLGGGVMEKSHDMISGM